MRAPGTGGWRRLPRWVAAFAVCCLVADVSSPAAALSQFYHQQLGQWTIDGENNGYDYCNISGDFGRGVEFQIEYSYNSYKAYLSIRNPEWDLRFQDDGMRVRVAFSSGEVFRGPANFLSYRSEVLFDYFDIDALLSNLANSSSVDISFFWRYASIVLPLDGASQAVSFFNACMSAHESRAAPQVQTPAAQPQPAPQPEPLLPRPRN